MNYTYSISWTGNTGLQKRLQHAADGTISIRADQAGYEALNNDLAIIPHVLKANAIWDLPNAPAELRQRPGAILNDWQISGVLTANPANPTI